MQSAHESKQSAHESTYASLKLVLYGTTFRMRMGICTRFFAMRMFTLVAEVSTVPAEYLSGLMCARSLEVDVRIGADGGGTMVPDVRKLGSILVEPLEPDEVPALLVDPAVDDVEERVALAVGEVDGVEEDAVARQDVCGSGSARRTRAPGRGCCWHDPWRHSVEHVRQSMMPVSGLRMSTVILDTSLIGLVKVKISRPSSGTTCTFVRKLLSSVWQSQW